MKKSQILAALALAFALGVAVIPSANTYAQFVDKNDVLDTVTTEKVQDEIDAAKLSCGWHMTNGKQTLYYDLYEALGIQLNNAVTAINTEKATQFTTATTGIKDAYTTAIGDLKTAIAPALLPAGVPETLPDNINTYDKAVEFISKSGTGVISKISAASTATGANATAYNDAVDNLKSALDTAKAAVVTVEDAQAGILMGTMGVIENSTITGLTYDEAVAYANRLSYTENATRTCNVAFVRNLKVAIDNAQGLIDDTTQNYSESRAEKAIAAIKKALGGGTVTDNDIVKPSEGTTNKNEGNKAPDTGVLANEDGGASTTVAMVAGVATALTAAGAGVVAYRNARRSSRK